ncbi:MAG: FtsQ-type POTRA domain-containing protein, partial [Rickettsiales bacterium]|nr:FtsQ-type POTRA domain-containing protein [Rickettsiales bacterium]
MFKNVRSAYIVSVFCLLVTMVVGVMYNEKIVHVVHDKYQHVLDVSAGTDEDTVRLRLEHVFIEGQVNLTTDQLIEMLDVNVGEPILGIDIHAIRKRIEQNTWTDTVSVERQLP